MDNMTQVAVAAALAAAGDTHRMLCRQSRSAVEPLEAVVRPLVVEEMEPMAPSRAPGAMMEATVATAGNNSEHQAEHPSSLQDRCLQPFPAIFADTDLLQTGLACLQLLPALRGPARQCPLQYRNLRSRQHEALSVAGLLLATAGAPHPWQCTDSARRNKLQAGNFLAAASCQDARGSH